MKTLAVGEPAPDFALETQDGATVKLSDYRGKQPVVLIFYPMDQTPGCTAQLCAVRDDAERYKAAGVEVFGVNNGTAGSHKRFSTKHRLTAPLLVDKSLGVSSAYGVAVGFGALRAIRRTVVGISADGTVVFYRRGAPSTDEILGALSAPA